MDEHKKGEPKKVRIEFEPVTLWKTTTVLLAVLFVISLFTGGFGLSASGEKNTGANIQGNNPVQPTGGNPQPTIKAEISVEGEPCMGDSDADVTIVEFGDYQCPFCQRAFQQTFPEIKKLIDQGSVRYCVKDYPLPFHEQADEASVAANCAGKQGKYWEMHDKLFATQGSWTGNAAVASVFTGYAKELGLDESAFTSCFNDPAQKQEVQEDTAEGSTAGVTGTPSFFINGQQLVGAQPWIAFKTIIDAELSA